MRKKRQSNKQLSIDLMQALGEETIREAQNLLPAEAGDLSKYIRVEATEDSFGIDWDEPGAIIAVPEKYMDSESVLVSQGTNPNTAKPYGYAALTSRHQRTRKGKTFTVRAHTKYYSPGFKPVVGSKSGEWYTASPENNFGLKMASLRIRRNFLQEAWSKVYNQVDRQTRKVLPKAIKIHDKRQ